MSALDGVSCTDATAGGMTFTDAVPTFDAPAAMIPQLTNAIIMPNGTGINAEPNGYFQLFNRRALAIRDRGPAVMSEAFCSAGSIDSWFLQRYPGDKQIVIPELAVVHIQHEQSAGSGWNGDARAEMPAIMSSFSAASCSSFAGSPLTRSVMMTDISSSSRF